MSHPCPRHEPELSAFIDGELGPAVHAEVESHLRVCAACRAAVAQLRGVSRALRRWDAQETRYATSTGFRNRVLSKLGAPEERPAAVAAWRAAAAVALVAAGAGGFALLAPRFAPPRDDLDRLLARVGRLEETVGEPAPPAARAPAEPARIERVDPIEGVVAEEWPLESAVPAAPPESWEVRGDERFLSEALAEFDDYTRDRRTLSLVERMRAESRAQPAEAGVTAAAPPPSPLATFLGEVRVVTDNLPSFEQVQVWPIELAGSGDRGPRAFACGDALGSNVLRVTEGPTNETVLAVNNDKSRPVLVLAGDVLMGGRQDRVAREDVLIAPGERLSISTYPSGSERGNGTRKSSYREFVRSGGLATPDLRAIAAADRVFESGVSPDAFSAAVAQTLASLSSQGTLGSLDNLYYNPNVAAQAERIVKKFLKRLDAPNVVGFAFAAGSRVLGVEVFGDHRTFADHRDRLLQSYVLGVLSMDRRVGEPAGREEAAAALVRAAKGIHQPGPATGASLSIFRGADGVSYGYGLVDGTRVVHAVVFPGFPPGGDPSASRGPRRGPGDSNAPFDRGGPAPGGATRGGASGDGVEAR